MRGLRQQSPAPSPRKWTLGKQSQSLQSSLKLHDRTRSPSLNVPLESSPARLALTFLILCFITPSPCPKGYIIGWRVRVFQSMAYWKWKFHRISISVGPREGMPSLHFWYTSFTPLVQLGLDCNWNSSIVVLSPRFGGAFACF